MGCQVGLAFLCLLPLPPFFNLDSVTSSFTLCHSISLLQGPGAFLVQHSPLPGLPNVVLGRESGSH